MADEDKLLGIAKANRTTEYTYSEYRIDYDSADSVAELTTVDVTEDGETVTVSLAESEQTTGDYFSGALKNPPAGYPGHEAKQNFQRKILVEDEATRDEVAAELDEAGIDYEIEGVAPTDAEKEAFEQWGAMNSLDGAKALKWKRALEALDNGDITQVDYERGQNPHDGETFSKPGNARKGGAPPV